MITHLKLVETKSEVLIYIDVSKLYKSTVLVYCILRAIEVILKAQLNLTFEISVLQAEHLAIEGGVRWTNNLTFKCFILFSKDFSSFRFLENTFNTK